MNPIVSSLEGLSKLVNKTNDISQVTAEIKKLRALLQTQNGKMSLKELDAELGIWISKIDVIMKEPAGRQGMAKHALHWAEKLRKN